ncbi:MAG: universal stress protein [Labilithrix sp.]|nr:universal stress protein [Labilithrix sp.]
MSQAALPDRESRLAPPLRTVVVATDFSPGAMRALRRTQSLPLADGGEVVLVHVPPSREVAGQLLMDPRERVTRQVRMLRRAFDRLGREDVRVRAETSTGEPSIKILDIAKESRADIIVVGRHGAANLRRFLLGSTAERVIHRSPVPVLVVGTRSRGPYETPLVALSGGVESSFVLERALRVAAKACRVQIVGAAFVPLEGWLWGGFVSTREILQLRKTVRKKLTDAITSTIAPYQERGVRLRVLIGDGDAREVILGLVERCRADLLVLGTHARAGIIRFRLGSVAAHVIRHARCDVLVVRPPNLVAKGG